MGKIFGDKLEQVLSALVMVFSFAAAIFIFVANVLILISLKETITKGKIGVWIYPVAVFGCFVFAFYLNYHDKFMLKIRLNKTSNNQLPRTGV